MSVIEWDQATERFFEVGLDRGVLYLEDSSGVPWNGLLSVDEDVNASSDALYFNGEKLLDYISEEDSGLKIKAFTYPDAFLEYDGNLEVETGLFVTQQPRKSFGLSYRTLVGDGVVGEQLGYKIHLWYNLTAVSDPTSYETMDSNIDPITFGWSATTRPNVIEDYAPTAYVFADSRYMDPGVLSALEDILYGTGISEPTLPSLEDLFSIHTGITITDHGDGTWSASGPSSLITMLDSDTFEITEANAVYLDADTYTVSSS